MRCLKRHQAVPKWKTFMWLKLLMEAPALHLLFALFMYLISETFCQTPKFDHISPVLHTLHWLPVEQRIEYKLLLLAFKSVNNDGPSYLSDLLKFYIPSRQLRSSSDTRLLRTPSFRLKSFGQRKFS